MAKKIDVNGLDHYHDKVSAMLASEYSSSKTYAVGDYCFHAGTLYECTAAITTAENWTAGHWTAAKLAEDTSALKTALMGKSATITGGLLVNGYYVKKNGVVTASANFNCYKFDISDAEYLSVTLAGYDSTAAVASNSNYDATSIVGKTFSSDDKLIFPSGTLGVITEWTESAIVSGYNYLYVSCYKNNTPLVIGYEAGGALSNSIENKEDVTELKAKMLQAFTSYGDQLSSATKWAAFSNDANNLTSNKIYTVTYNTNISNLPYSDFNGFILVYAQSYNNTNVLMQMALRANGKELYQRVLWGSSWTNWFRLALHSDVSAMLADIESLKHTSDLWAVFHTVGIIGDSLASGESASNEGGSTAYHDLYPFSWGQCMARESGNTYYNFSCGGLTTKTWMTNTSYGYAIAAQQDKLCDAYIIGLGVNDNAQGMTVGTSADINESDPDLNADTFYGNYGKIIQKLQLLAPKAPIFVITFPTLDNSFSDAIKDMAEIFSNVFVLDLYKYANEFTAVNGIIHKCLRSGHYNAVGYKVISKYISQEISSVMIDNIEDFLQVEFINTEYSWTE